MKIDPYAFQEAEQLRLGRFPVLDTILYRWARYIEETLFEQFQIEMYAGASIVEEMKFSAFYASLKAPKPIYFVDLRPLEGRALLVLDNRFANLCINRVDETGGPARDADRLTLAPHNQGRLQHVVTRMMEDFERSWHDVHPVQVSLKKVTTFLFRARILQSYERCLVAQIHLSGERVSARLTWCFPRILLDSILPELQRSRVIPSLVPERQARARVASQQLLEAMDYRLSVSLGRLDPNPGEFGFEEGSVIPLRGDLGGGAVISINGRPLLAGSVGETHGRYAVRVTGPYRQERVLQAAQGESFRSVHWPSHAAH